MRDRTFGDLLTRALRTIAAIENRSILVIEDEIGLEMGRSGRSAVEYWRKGFVPHPDIVLRLAKLCVQRGHLDPAWAEWFLRSGQIGKSEKARSEAGSEETTATAGQTQGRIDLDFDLVVIGAGNFLMGSDATTDRDADLREHPLHLVYLSAYKIARVPVTVAQYAAFLAATGYRQPDHWSDRQYLVGRMSHPAVGVSWHDAQEFCNWAQVRLPSEAEWEKAARGTDRRRYPWGDQAPDRQHCNYDMNVGSTTPVGEYPRGASPYGVLDMCGNVWEWTSTLWGTDPMQTAFPYPWDPNDGRQDLSADSSWRRIVRGGAYDRYPRYLRVSARRFLVPSARYPVVGFRVAGD